MSAFPRAALVADGQALFRMALTLTLRESLSFSQVAEAETFEDLCRRLDQDGPFGLVTINPSLAGIVGFASLQALRLAYPDTKIVIVSDSDQRTEILAALEAGMHGYIPKTLRLDAMIQAIRIILDGGVYVSGAVANAASFKASQTDEAPPHARAKPPVPLTERQRCVLDLLAKGKSNKEIAGNLGLAEGTVKVHLNALYQRLGVHNRVNALKVLAREDGPVS